MGKTAAQTARLTVKPQLDMKTPPHMRCFVSTCFVLLALIGCSCKSDHPRGDINPSRDYLLHAQTDALQAKIVLTELRDGHLTNALELLEMQIDTSIVMIDSLSHVPGPERDAALDTLRVLKAYREAHPRQREAILQDADKEDVEEMNRATQKASRILSDLK
jgi:hypothetical protein